MLASFLKYSLRDFSRPVHRCILQLPETSKYAFVNNAVAIAVNKNRPGDIQRFVYCQFVTFVLSVFPLHRIYKVYFLFQIPRFTSEQTAVMKIGYDREPKPSQANMHL
ncbi:hypothetical protein HPULCUR_010823 [Helicostylum pulchrum]|uniref:Uncharacterized protein n=1 Tax=Helicostylum pulchrum TaxID=562976 RepID=A0ABP9YEC3_9FUNG